MNRLVRWLLGQPDTPIPIKPNAQKALTLTVLFAWIGLGADGLSSSCYGPEQAFLALGDNSALALWLAVATFLTVFIIAFAYNRVISLFPNGGGGYKVATNLLNPYAGVIAGSALIVDYLLTIVISIASGTDAIFSLLPPHWAHYRLLTDMLLIIFLTYLNMRGVKESIKILLPIFLGFVFVHLALIIYGIASHEQHFPHIIQNASTDTHRLFFQNGLFFTLAIFMHAYAQGGGTYTGLEAVSNNVNILAEPRVRTGKLTMFYMALSLALTATGIILLYLLWDVHPSGDRTLNAIVFESILGKSTLGHIVLMITLALEAGLLFVAANTGFLGGPAVLANLAVDEWVPKIFLNLSSALVKQNGVVLFGLAAIALLFITKAHVALLVILYSASVFLAFTIALTGLLRHQFSHIERSLRWWFDLISILIGVLICSIIFIIVIFTSFTQGSWLAILLLGLMVGFCFFIRSNYKTSNKLVESLDKELYYDLPAEGISEPSIDPSQPTAIIFVGKSVGAAMHTLLTIKRVFQSHYTNYIFLSVGVVDSYSFAGQEKIKRVEKQTKDVLDYLCRFCWVNKLSAKSFFQLSVDPLSSLQMMAEKVQAEFSDSTFFASQLVFSDDHWGQKIIHNATAFALQRQICKLGYNMMIFPVRVMVKAKRG